MVEKQGGVNWLLIPGDIGGTGLIVCENPLDEEGKIGLDTIDAKSEVYYKNTKDELKVAVEISVVTRVSANQERRYNLDKTENIMQINQRSSETVKEKIYKAIEISKEHRADIFGFGDLLYRTDPDRYYELKDDWDKVYEDLEVAVKVETEIRRSGLIRR